MSWNNHLLLVIVLLGCLAILVICVRNMVTYWRRKSIGRSLLCGAIVVVAIYSSVVLLAMELFAPIRKRSRCCPVQCQTNLHQFDLALQAYCYPPVEHYPINLSELPAADVCLSQFMCPTDPDYKNTLGSISNASEWTSYIYITCLTNGLSPAVPTNMPIIICPPLFHKGEGWNVVMGDHSVTWHTNPALVDRLIENPLCMCSNPPPELRSNIYVHVSKRLEKLSKGKYRSHAVTNWSEPEARRSY